ncbi:hypothetical protein BDN67DRAFT_986060, partial [Paxillus ammoniavirescens]
MPGTTLPPFPTDVPAHPLLIIDFELIKAGVPVEIERQWEAAATLGFWYLKNHGGDKENAGASAVDASGTYPAPITAAIPTVVTPFIRKAPNINYTMLHLSNEKLGLSEGTLERLHDLEEYSGSEARAIRSPPMPGKVTAERVTLGSHTDFESLAFLHNRLGGLQVLPPGHTEWSYVK